jgi:hypothetical protein
MEAHLNRPLSVTILSVIVLCITSWNAIRIYGALVNWDILREFGASPVYIMVSGVLWAAVGLWLAYATWTGKRRAFGAGLVSAALYLAWYWLDRLVMQPAPAPNLAFSAIVSAVLLVYVVISLIVSRAFFDKERG